MFSSRNGVYLQGDAFLKEHLLKEQELRERIGFAEAIHLSTLVFRIDLLEKNTCFILEGQSMLYAQRMGCSARRGIRKEDGQIQTYCFTSTITNHYNEQEALLSRSHIFIPSQSVTV